MISQIAGRARCAWPANSLLSGLIHTASTAVEKKSHFHAKKALPSQKREAYKRPFFSQRRERAGHLLRPTREFLCHFRWVNGLTVLLVKREKDG